MKWVDVVRFVLVILASMFGGAIVGNPDQIEGQDIAALVKNLLAVIGLGGAATALSFAKVQAFLGAGRDLGRKLFDDSTLPETMQRECNAAWALRETHPDAAREMWVAVWDRQTAKPSGPEIANV